MMLRDPTKSDTSSRNERESYNRSLFAVASSFLPTECRSSPIHQWRKSKRWKKTTVRRSLVMPPAPQEVEFWVGLWPVLQRRNQDSPHLSSRQGVEAELCGSGGVFHRSSSQTSPVVISKLYNRGYLCYPTLSSISEQMSCVPLPFLRHLLVAWIG